MAQDVPSIHVTDARPRETSPYEKQDAGKLSAKPEGGTRIASMLRNPAASNAPSDITNRNTAYPEGPRTSDATAIDPLSQQIFQRTGSSAQKLRTQLDNAVPQSPTSPTDSLDAKQAPDTVREAGGGPNTKHEKKKGLHVSFLSRLIGNKKKGGLDGATDDGCDEADVGRPEGMDAEIFSHTVDNLGFSPKHPPPPAYIKVRTKFKKEKEFDRLFLAQELRSARDKDSPPAAGANPSPQSGAAATQNPIWATEFSKDGKHLAAGGQDRIVRVWTVISTPEERRAHEKDESDPSESGEESTRLSAPVFLQTPTREYHGHTATILDLSWSKNNFLLSSSMDKTVRLWHISRAENLCTFKHADFVPSIQFHPRDDRFFLAGSLDCKLRLWSIPDKSVAFWNQLPDMITAVSFTPDGKTCIAGTLSGLCMFYETEGLKYQTQIHVKSTRGQNAKGSKITGIRAATWPPGSKRGEVKLLISSNDSRIRMYNFRDKSLEMKFRGHENNCSQIRATFAEDTGHILCGSEDRKAYIWSTSAPEGEKRNQRPVEMFEAHNSITTCAVIAPLKTRHLLGASEDPIFDLCNPPPVTLVSRAESVSSSIPPTDPGSAVPTPTPTDSTNFKRVAETPAYIARSAHLDGNIIVTADYTGAIKVFRQDCAYAKRLRAMENAFDASSVFSKRTGSRHGPASLYSRRRRDSTSTQPPDDRIMSWRQDISHGSISSHATTTGKMPPTQRPHTSHSHSPAPAMGTRLGYLTTMPTSDTPKTSSSLDRTLVQSSSTEIPSSTPNSNSQTSLPFDPTLKRPQTSDGSAANPLAIHNGQSWAFWHNNMFRDMKLAPKSTDATRSNSVNSSNQLDRKITAVSKLTDEEDLGSSDSDGEGEGDVRCRRCGAEEFKVKVVREERRLVCGECGAETK